MHGIGVRRRMDGNRRNAELLAGAQHPKRNFTAVGNEDLVEHHSMIINGSPNSTGCASPTRICVTVPERGAGIWFMVFIASTISSVSPATTLLPTSTNGIAPGSGPRYAVPTMGEVTTPG